jgi:hypothetical protein
MQKNLVVVSGQRVPYAVKSQVFEVGIVDRGTVTTNCHHALQPYRHARHPVQDWIGLGIMLILGKNGVIRTRLKWSPGRGTSGKVNLVSVISSFFCNQFFINVIPIKPTTTSWESVSSVTLFRTIPFRSFRFNNMARQFSPS